MRQLNRNRQQGAMGGIILGVLIFGGLLSMGARLGPLYLDHNTISTIMDKMAEEPGLGIKTDNQLIDIMKQRLKLNNIREFPIQEHVEFERSGRGTDVILDYEVRIPLIQNLDIIASFNKEIELRD